LTVSPAVIVTSTPGALAYTPPKKKSTAISDPATGLGISNL